MSIHAEIYFFFCSSVGGEGRKNGGIDFISVVCRPADAGEASCISAPSGRRSAIRGRVFGRELARAALGSVGKR